MKRKKFIKGDFVFEDLGDSVRTRDIFSNHVLEIVPKKKRIG